MSLLWLLIAGAVGAIIWSTVRSLRRSTSPGERALVLRGIILFWMLAALFVAALAFLPNKGRVLALVPIVLIVGAVANAFRASRRQLRARAAEERRFADARRIN